ncbi:hypothetical protein [Paenarthrobacter ureafaciens]|uniref:hypothetical protein n=1 Tax=Paenarthrobacter ureafaciens TaxID=37931 RepID=UPI001C2C3764|nr:hypothetical protein [Paenarthrobacter ureafaciens]
MLQEISWESAPAYREGGRGRENVLSAEVLMALDYLPRTAFMGQIFRTARGAEKSKNAFIDHIESAVMEFLPGDLPLAPESGPLKQLYVQPDAVLTTENSFVLIEAKRIRRSAFQAQQLAREYVAALAHSQGRSPLILLLGAEPPLQVKGRGRLSLKEAIRVELRDVLHQSSSNDHDFDTLLSQISDVFCWITWDGVNDVVSTRQAAAFASLESSVHASVQRLAGSITGALAWHS